MIPLIYNSIKCKLIFGDKQISCCLEMGGQVMERSGKESLQRDMRKFGGMKHVFIALIVVMVSQVCQNLSSCTCYMDFYYMSIIPQ